MESPPQEIAAGNPLRQQIITVLLAYARSTFCFRLSVIAIFSYF